MWLVGVVSRRRLWLDHANITNYIDKNVERTYIDCAHVSPEISTCEVPRDVSRKLRLTLCAIMVL